MSETLILNGKDLTLEDLYSVVYDRRPVQIDPEVIPLVDKSRQVLFDMAADGKPVYGLNHGVGWNKDREFSQDFFEQYNRNLINSHSLGVAPFASVEEVRAMMCIRLNTALCGRTGIASNILKMYEEFLNRGIHPRAMRRGAVGKGDVSTMSMIGQARSNITARSSPRSTPCAPRASSPRSSARRTAFPSSPRTRRANPWWSCSSRRSKSSSS